MTRRTLFLMWMTCALASLAWPERSGVAQDARRVRSDSAAVMALLDSGARDSATFKQLVIAIEGTDGVVYVRAGKCPGYRIKGCLLHKMSATVGRRYLWVALDMTGQPIDSMVTIAHELRHALEILSDGSIRTGRGIFSFYHPNGNPGPAPLKRLQLWRRALRCAVSSRKNDVRRWRSPPELSPPCNFKCDLAGASLPRLMTWSFVQAPSWTYALLRPFLCGSGHCPGGPVQSDSATSLGRHSDAAARRAGGDRRGRARARHDHAPDPGPDDRHSRHAHRSVAAGMAVWRVPRAARPRDPGGAVRRDPARSVV